MKLQKDIADRIQELFTRHMVWQDMARERLDIGDWQEYGRLIKTSDDAVIALYEEFGIELPTYKQTIEKAA